VLALRVVIGWHFFKEGTGKLQDPKPFSANFFGAAKGPFASTYARLVWDADGTARFDPQATRIAWESFRDRAKNHYQFDADQIDQSQKIIDRRIEQLGTYLDANGAAISEYLWWVERRDQNQADPKRREYREVASLKGQADKLESKVKADRGPWLAEIDRLQRDFEREINGLATPQQRSRGELRGGKPGRRWLDSEAIDKVIPYFDLTVGALLVVGLFTRLAALAGAGFLATVVLSQFPGSAGAAPSYYQAIEMVALICLAALGAGQFAGLDVVIRALRCKCCPPRQEGST